MFADCEVLAEFDMFDTSSATNMTNMFNNCPNLNQESIDNILQMCINASNYSGTKTFTELGLLYTNSGSTYQQWAQESEYYQDFVDAGWSVN